MFKLSDWKKFVLIKTFITAIQGNPDKIDFFKTVWYTGLIAGTFGV